MSTKFYNGATAEINLWHQDLKAIFMVPHSSSSLSPSAASLRHRSLLAQASDLKAIFMVPHSSSSLSPSAASLCHRSLLAQASLALVFL